MRFRWLASIGILLAAAAFVSAQSDQTPPVPFYRQYLVPGNPLDDQILEQEKRVEAAPEDAGLHTDLGNLLAKRRFPEQAAEQYEIAAKLDPKNYVALYNLGLLLETQGQVNDAISAYKKSIKRKPGFPPSRFHLGLLYERTNRADAAVGEYAKALRIDPDMRDPKRNPLVVESELIYRASLANYSHDQAVVAMQRDAVFVEESRFRRIPVDRPLSAEEVAATEEPEAAPREVGPGTTGAAGAEGAPARRPRPATSTDTTVPIRPRPAGAGTPPVRTPRGPRAVVPPNPPQAAPAPVPTPAPDEVEVAPEAVPEATPTPAEPVEVEPS